MSSAFSTECVAEFKYIFENDTMRPKTLRVDRLARKYSLTKAQVIAWFGYRRRKVLKTKESSTPAENQEDFIIPARGTRYSAAIRSMYTQEQLEAMEDAEDADREFMELLIVSK